MTNTAPVVQARLSIRLAKQISSLYDHLWSLNSRLLAVSLRPGLLWSVSVVKQAELIRINGKLIWILSWPTKMS